MILGLLYIANNGGAARTSDAVSGNHGNVEEGKKGLSE